MSAFVYLWCVSLHVCNDWPVFGYLEKEFSQLGDLLCNKLMTKCHVYQSNSGNNKTVIASGKTLIMFSVPKGMDNK